MAARAQQQFDAVASPIRREVLWLTWDQELSVGEIGEHFDITGPTLSAHLATLRAAGLISCRVDGNFRRYRCSRDAVGALVPFLASNDERWVAASDLPERGLATAAPGVLVVVAVDVPVDQATAFEGFVDAERYSEWLGRPVSIRGRRFRTTLEWGTEVRGTYEVVAPPDLLAMRWDFDDEAVPMPGRGLVAYLRVHPTRKGSRVEVHQHAADDRQAEFLAAAWSMVLGRFAEHHAAAPRRAAGPRAPRPKRP
ncbi:MAG: metalloregulator ArsR/SmtB family transcription factor [Acidimicrobiia bacterium]|nr:metalloregulator ArsR/SmtB family transcription factor [Acidimicrobiia bacterium]